MMRLLTVFLLAAVLCGGLSDEAVALTRGTPDAGAGRITPNVFPADARYPGLLYGQPIRAGKATADTVYLMGGPGRLDGKFQLADEVTPDRQGWIGVDRSVPDASHWHVSTWNGRAQLDPAFNPNHTMWCGEILEPCSPTDPPEGYSNKYDEWLDWYGTVANNTVATNVTVTCVLNNDSEPDYDYLRFVVFRAAGQDELVAYHWTNTLVGFTQTFSVTTADYVGAGLNQIHLRWLATSDTGWSDADCHWPTYGHSNLDNIRVMTDNGVSTYDDFEGESSTWMPSLPPACGDFSRVWPRLNDLDPCAGNTTPVFAFIDDGNVVPGTGGTLGDTWTYGPGGYVFNSSGGLAGPRYHVWNEIWSPPLAWPGPDYSGFNYGLSVYGHLPLSTGVFMYWGVRSSADGGATWGTWQDIEPLYYGSANWVDYVSDFTSKLPNDRTHVQLVFGAWDRGWIWGYISDDTTPAPYLDNVRALAYTYAGPAVTARDIYLFNDNFPAIGSIDYANPGRNSVRLDMASNISPRTNLRNDPGDSIVVNVAVTRAGATLQGYPKLYYKLKPNHLFDPWRTSGLPNLGVVNGDTTKTAAGVVVANSWRWDLPDSSFFFPGDVLHYYIEAQDDLAGDIATTRLPADTTGFSLFPSDPGYIPLRYPSMFIVRALPSLKSATPGDQPHILFWNDFADRGGENEWNGALTHLTYTEGVDYDEYYTNGPSSGVGNGLGGRAQASQLAGYDVMLYTSGDLMNYTLCNGDGQRTDPSRDILVMTQWFWQGHKKWFCTGDHLAYDLGRSGTVAVTFRNTYLSMVFNSQSIRPLIQNQINPVVLPVAGNAVGLTQSYIAQGNCETVNTFDAVQATAGSERIATFQPASGPDYPYAAGLYVPNAGGYEGNAVVYMPYDFMRISKVENTAKAPAMIEKRAQVLGEILTFFGQAAGGPPTGTGDAPALAFTARSFPNPFNPSTKIEYTLPRDGRLSIRIYNVRGELVRTLLEQPMKAGPGSVIWTGDDDHGRNVASGIYFCQVRAAEGEILKKIALVR